MKRIGITTFYYHNWNFGGMLQGYALYKRINNLGYNSEEIWMSIKRPETSMGPKMWNYVESNIITMKVVNAFYLQWSRQRKNFWERTYPGM